MTTDVADLDVLRVKRQAQLERIADANAVDAPAAELDNLHRQLLRLDMAIALASRAARHEMKGIER